MRILMIEPGPNFSVADVHRGWRKAFAAAGCEVANVNFADRLTFYSSAAIRRDNGRYVKALNGDDAIRVAQQGIEAALYEFWPDVVMVTSCMFVQDRILDIMRARGHKVVLNLTESPYEDGAQLRHAEHADLVLLNDPTNLDVFQQVTDAYYQHHCYDPAVHYRRPVQPDYQSDFCFVGTGFPSRIQFFEQVNWDGIDATFAGNWAPLLDESPLVPFLAHEQKLCIDNSDAVELYSNTRVSANLYRREAENEHLVDGWAMGPREVELAATGTFFLTEKRGENADVLPMIPTFDGPVDFEEKLRWWLAHPDEADQVAADARAAIADRTFENAAKDLLAHLS